MGLQGRWWDFEMVVVRDWEFWVEGFGDCGERGGDCHVSLLFFS